MTKLPVLGSIIIHEAHRRRIAPVTHAYVVDAIRTFETEDDTRVTYFASPYNEAAKKSGNRRLDLRPYSFEDDEEYGPSFVVVGHKDNL